MRTVNMTTWLAMGFLVLAAAGCARPDWIEQMLVTADVTGVWRRDITGGGGGTSRMPMVLTLLQSGPKMTGKIVAGPGRVDGPIEEPSVATFFASATQGGVRPVNYR